MSRIRLLVTDVDNTLFDWVTYYTHCFWALLESVSKRLDIDVEQLALESRTVFERYGSIEYPFLVQELPSVMAKCQNDIEMMLDEVMEPARKVFLDMSGDYLKPYAGVHETLKRIKKKYPDVPLIALTDAPRYVAMWKMNKLDLLSDFDAIYGLPDPQVPTCEVNNRVKVKPGILLKHLQQYNFGYEGRIRTLPEDYEKPGTKGLRTVLMDYEFDTKGKDPADVMWIGDNRRKDIALGKALGVTTVWAEYGTKISKEQFAVLNKFSPPMNVQKNANIESEGEVFEKPDYTIQQFSDIEKIF